MFSRKQVLICFCVFVALQWVVVAIWQASGRTGLVTPLMMNFYTSILVAGFVILLFVTRNEFKNGTENSGSLYSDDVASLYPVIRLKTHAANPIWKVYLAVGNPPDEESFFKWIVEHILNGDLPEINNLTVEDYLFSDRVKTSTSNYIGNGQVYCFVFQLWERQSDGSKKWTRIYVSEMLGEVFYQPGTSHARSSSMTPTESPVNIDNRLQQFLSPKT